MNDFICPVCKNRLVRESGSYKCENKHCFDISRKGTVNLLLSQKSNHGDDKLMVRARNDFLNKGYYEPLLNAVIKAFNIFAENSNTIVDCGCGECYYTVGIYEDLKSLGKNTDIIGIDVSKEAINLGASRSKELKLAVASVFDIPVSDNSVDIVLSMFAPFSRDEYIRILKDNGYYITAFPLENHLWELKQAVYDTPYKNEVSAMGVDGFELVYTDDVHSTIRLCTNNDIKALFAMTPYYYKTSAKDHDKLNFLNELSTSIDFRVAVYKKA